MIRNTAIYITARFCEWRAVKALRSHHNWLKRAEVFFQRIKGQSK